MIPWKYSFIRLIVSIHPDAILILGLICSNVFAAKAVAPLHLFSPSPKLVLGWSRHINVPVSMCGKFQAYTPQNAEVHTANATWGDSMENPRPSFARTIS